MRSLPPHPVNPWRRLRDLGDEEPDGVVFGQRALPSGKAWWVPSERVIVMRPGLLQVERRCALAHELGHRELGHAGQCEYEDAGRQAGRDEAAADQWAAHLLVTLEALADVLVWTDDRDEAAEELWVTRRLLDVRLEQAARHPAERAYVARRLQVVVRDEPVDARAGGGVPGGGAGRRGGAGVGGDERRP